MTVVTSSVQSLCDENKNIYLLGVPGAVVTVGPDCGWRENSGPGRSIQ